MSRRRFSLPGLKFKTKLNLGLCAVIISLGLIQGLITTQIAATGLIQENQERGQLVTSNLAYRAEEPILARNFLRLKSLVDEVSSAKLCAHRRRAAITIADTGSGIKQDMLDKIFDPFFSTKPVGKGTGLGLSVTFGIIKDHGGRINVLSPAPMKHLSGIETESSEPGTVFLIELPLWEMTLPDEECEELALS
ncbi:MAG: sensor histidine kinase [Desulfohalobiaceae bacterium]